MPTLFHLLCVVYFLFTTAVSRPDLEHTQPPIRWTPGDLSCR